MPSLHHTSPSRTITGSTHAPPYLRQHHLYVVGHDGELRGEGQHMERLDPWEEEEE